MSFPDIADIVESNKQFVSNIYNIVTRKITDYVDHIIINKSLILDDDTVSIVMCSHNLNNQIIFCLRHLSNSVHKNIQVIIVDDSSEPSTIDARQLFTLPFRIDYVKINKQIHKWINPCINYCIGFTFVKGSKVIIQNPEIFHVGDIIEYVYNNCVPGSYLVFPVYASTSHISNSEIYKRINRRKCSYDIFQQMIVDDPELRKHIVKHGQNLQFLASINSVDLLKLRNLFGYDLSLGMGYEYASYSFCIEKVLSLNVVNINDSETQMTGCQLHYDIPKSKINMSNNDRKQAIAINRFIYNNKISEFALTKQWNCDYIKNNDVSFTSDPNFVFIRQTQPCEYSNQTYYRKLAILLRNIVNSCGYRTSYCDISSYNDPTILIKNSTPNDIFVITALDFGLFYRNAWYKECTFDCLINVFQKINYIVIWQEVLSNDLSIVGYEKSAESDEFTKYFFTNSKLNIVSNKISLDSLQGLGLKNTGYSILGGYSEINGHIPFSDTNSNKSIDVLIYCALESVYKHRLSVIDQLRQINEKNHNYNIVVTDGIVDNVLDEYLLKSKMVVHIASFSNLVHMPWAKISYLFARKVFCIIEENEEFYTNPNYSHIPYFLNSNAQDLYDKIDHYLQNPAKMSDIVEKNYNFIKKYSNLDVTINNLLKTI